MSNDYNVCEHCLADFLLMTHGGYVRVLSLKEIADEDVCYVCEKEKPLYEVRNI